MAFPSIQSLPIFSNGVHYDHYPYEQLNEYQRAIFTDATSSRGRLCSSVKQITLKSFECYLQITRQLATPRSQSKFRKVAEGFLGFYIQKNILKRLRYFAPNERSFHINNSFPIREIPQQERVFISLDYRSNKQIHKCAE